MEVKEFDSKDFGKRVWFDGIRYSVPLPWKDDVKIKIRSDLVPCRKQLLSLVERLRKEPDKLKTYDGIIRQQEKDGIIERCYATPPNGKVHYMPHHCVIKEESTTSKLRIVNNASFNKPSLNDCLEKGPCLLPLLLDVLMRFRTFKVALVGDIKQAYLMIAVDESDRDYLRFIWLEDLYADEPKMIIYRFCRVFFGMISAQFLLLLVIHIHLAKYGDTENLLILHILLSLYVDDYTGGASNTKEAFERYQKIKKMFTAAGLDMRKWRSNNAELQKKINEFEVVETPLAEKGVQNQKILGVNWDFKKDVLYATMDKMYEKGRSATPSKRMVLKTVAGIYNPIGTIAPIIIKFKIFFQKLTIKKWRCVRLQTVLLV